MIDTIRKYEKKISTSKERFFKGNLDYLHNSLNIILTALQPRELVSFYLLVSYLRRKKADNENLVNEFAEFATQFLQNLNAFSIYDTKPPLSMPEELFKKYQSYKLEAKVMTTPDSIKQRFDIVLDEFNRMQPNIVKDEKRLHDIEQKRTLYFRQKGKCGVCNKEMDFRSVSAHHVIGHSQGGRTDDLEQAILLHEKCHQKLEKQIQKEKNVSKSPDVKALEE